MKDYPINVTYCEEDEGYIADIPDLNIVTLLRHARGSAKCGLKAKVVWLEVATFQQKAYS